MRPLDCDAYYARLEREYHEASGGERGDELLIATLLIDPLTNERMFSVDDIMAGILDDTPSADINTLARKAYELYGRTDSPKLVTDEDREKNSSETALKE